MSDSAIEQQLADILESLRRLVLMAYEADDYGLAVWAGMTAGEVAQFLMGHEQARGA